MQGDPVATTARPTSAKGKSSKTCATLHSCIIIAWLQHGTCAPHMPDPALCTQLALVHSELQSYTEPSARTQRQKSHVPTKAYFFAARGAAVLAKALPTGRSAAAPKPKAAKGRAAVRADDRTKPVRASSPGRAQDTARAARQRSASTDPAAPPRAQAAPPAPHQRAAPGTRPAAKLLAENQQPVPQQANASVKPVGSGAASAPMPAQLAGALPQKVVPQQVRTPQQGRAPRRSQSGAPAAFRAPAESADYHSWFDVRRSALSHSCAQATCSVWSTRLGA